MASSTFTFGFSGDDIDADADTGEEETMPLDGTTTTADDEAEAARGQGGQSGRKKPLLPPRKHPWAETLSALPSCLSYNTLSIPLQATATPTATDYRPPTIRIRRRSLFDVLAQLKAESDIQLRPSPDQGINIGTRAQTDPGGGTTDADHDHEALIAALEGGDDLRARLYEGGFKTWECGVDLATYLAEHLWWGGTARNLDLDLDLDLERWLLDGGICGCEDGGGDLDEGGRGGVDIVELGAGSGIPTLVLLHHILRRRKPQSRRRDDDSGRDGQGPDAARERQGGDGIRFILCDYNVEVLRLVTAANVLLQVARNGLIPSAVGVRQDGAETAGRGGDVGEDEDEDEDEGELDLDDMDSDGPLDQTVLASLNEVGVSSIDFVSGAWGDEFVELIFPAPAPPSPPAAAAAAGHPPFSSSTSPSSPEPPARMQEAQVSPRERQTRLLILCSETIYSPSTLPAFTCTLLSLLRRRSAGGGGGSMALVAAKKVYFGVGGGVDGFREEAQRRGGVVQVLREIGGGGSGRGGGRGWGIGRVILKVTLD